MQVREPTVAKARAKKTLNLGEAFAPGIAAATPGANKCTLDFETFFRADLPNANYKWGIHTYARAKVLQRAFDTAQAGGRFYYIFIEPPRHGKSDMASRRFGPFVLCRNPDAEIILDTYGSELSEKLSVDARDCFERMGKQFGLTVRSDVDSKSNWRIANHRGGFAAVGTGGTLTGTGAHHLIIDDYFKNRRDAESETISDFVWDEFTSTLMTRLSPNGHSVGVVANRWHHNDLVARIHRKMAEDPNFPRFETIVFPAWSEDRGWLFPERFSAEQYEAMRSLGEYVWESQYQGNPHPRGGAFLKIDKLQFADEMPQGLRWVRAWDLASTAKERRKDDPDFTAGALVAFHDGKLFVADVRRGQWTAPRRDDYIVKTHEEDGRAVRVKIEAVAGYKDTVENLRARVPGGVASFRPDSDKISRAAIVESFCEFGNVVLKKGAWNADFISELAAFPNGHHDDQVDAFVSAAEDCITTKHNFTRLEML